MYVHMYLCNVISVHPTFDSDPRTPLERSVVLKHPENVGHLSDGHHQLLPLPHAQVTYVLDGLLHVLLFEGLDVHVALDALLGHHTLDL